MFDCNQDITIWNRWKDPLNKQADEVFYRHVIPVKCKFKNSVVKTAGDSGVIFGNAITIIIPYTVFYVPYEVWIMISEDERRNLFTFNLNDLVALGVKDAEINSSPNGIKESEIKSMYSPNACHIKSVKDNTHSKHGKHYKLEGA